MPSIAASRIVEFILMGNGVLLALLMLLLTYRASRIPGLPFAHVQFSICAVAWCAGGFIRSFGITHGVSSTSEWYAFSNSLQMAATAFLPVPILGLWRNYSERPIGWLERIAIAWAGVALIALVLMPPLAMVPRVTAGILTVGAVVSLRWARIPGTVYWPSLCLVICAWIDGQAALVGGFCAFLLFARFRYADLFVRYGIRLMLAGLFTSALLYFFGPTGGHGTPHRIHLFSSALMANFVLLSFSFFNDWVTGMVNRWLFHTAEQEACAEELGRAIEGLDSEQQVLEHLASVAKRMLELESSEVSAAGLQEWPKELSKGAIVEDDKRLLVPILEAGVLSYVLTIRPSARRPGLVLQDLQSLEKLAELTANRLTILRRQQEALEKHRLERQFAEAELRALRAQIHPHFLFNSLNTIADLISPDPATAETMTVRLAQVFRHVLKNASRPLTTIGEEIEFIRGYLSIEETRFRDRLKVEIDVPDELVSFQIPSLILQPLVENALKHGLASKPGPAYLAIRASELDGTITITVEDSGLGPGSDGAGMGLSNVSQRLETHYQGEAGFQLEARSPEGSIAKLWFPKRPL